LATLFLCFYHSQDNALFASSIKPCGENTGGDANGSDYREKQKINETGSQPAVATNSSIINRTQNLTLSTNYGQPDLLSSEANTVQNHNNQGAMSCQIHTSPNRAQELNTSAKKKRNSLAVPKINTSIQIYKLPATLPLVVEEA
jgi:hypothetical protein